MKSEFEHYYGFTGAPFSLSLDTGFYFESQEHLRAFSYLQYGIKQGDGFVIITGEVGCGKTTLAAELCTRIDAESICLARLSVVDMTGEDLLRMILNKLVGHEKRTGKADLLEALERFLQEQAKIGRRVLLVLDEAQTLSASALEDLRAISNLVVEGRPGFQAVLLGQTQLLTKLAVPELLQFRQRVIASFQMGPLLAAEVRQYIEHRLRKVGWTGDPAFSEQAVDLIGRATRGVPRLINLVCNRILLYGAIERLHEIDSRHVACVLADFHTDSVDSLSRAFTTEGQKAPPDSPAEPGKQFEELVDNISVQLDVRQKELSSAQVWSENKAWVVPTSIPNQSEDGADLHHRMVQLERQIARQDRAVRELTNAGEALLKLCQFGSDSVSESETDRSS